MSGVRYRRAPGLVVRAFDVAGAAPSHLVEGPGGRRWDVSGATAALLDVLAEPATVPELAGRLAGRVPGTVGAEPLAQLLDGRLVPGGLVVVEGEGGAGGAPAEAPGGPRGRLGTLRLRTTLLSERWAARLARPLQPLMAPAAFWPGLALAAALGAAAWAHLGGARALHPGAVLAPGVVIALAAATLAHELGHVAAARHFGCAPGRVRAGVYTVFPVLFVELDDVWRLPRGQRAVVDLAGLYAQGLVALAAAALGVMRPAWRADAAAVLAATAVSAVVNLNPAFRFDGYWLLSDALGVPNLRRRSLAALRSVAAGGPPTPDEGAPLTGARAWAVAAVAALTAALLALWVVRFAVAVPRDLRGALVPAAQAVADAVGAGRLPPPAAAWAVLARGVVATALGLAFAPALARWGPAAAARAWRSRLRRRAALPGGPG